MHRLEHNRLHRTAGPGGQGSLPQLLPGAHCPVLPYPWQPAIFSSHCFSLPSPQPCSPVESGASGCPSLARKHQVALSPGCWVVAVAQSILWHSTHSVALNCPFPVLTPWRPLVQSLPGSDCVFVALAGSWLVLWPCALETSPGMQPEPASPGRAGKYWPEAPFSHHQSVWTDPGEREQGLKAGPPGEGVPSPQKGC